MSGTARHYFFKRRNDRRGKMEWGVKGEGDRKEGSIGEGKGVQD